MGLAAYGFGGRSAPSDADPEATKAVPVTRMTLVDYEDAPGQIGYGPVTTLRYLPPPAAGGSGEPGAAGDAGGLGLLTWLPPIGSTVDRGGAALRVDDRPVVVLFGALPLYRALHAGERGADVRQLEQNLAALGLTGFTVDDDFTASTAAAVRRWQHALALPETGQVAPGQVVFTPGAIRVADHRLRVGDVATGDILGMTGTVRTVTATVDTTRLHRVVAPGSAVTIVFDDGAQTLATVRSVDRPPVDPQAAPAKDSVVLVEAEVSDQAALADREGAVTVRFVADERPDVLAVPVLALVALAEGGYGVEVVEGSTTRYVPVTTGLFARGYVEITSGDLRAGMTILVPA
jgi:peptidoglycan hydrolase-like protein with peptidoglycan-binding domain